MASPNMQNNYYLSNNNGTGHKQKKENQQEPDYNYNINMGNHSSQGNANPLLASVNTQGSLKEGKGSGINIQKREQIQNIKSNTQFSNM